MKQHGPDSPPAATYTQPFAVTSTTANFRAIYDPNGNTLLRVEISGTQRITYLQEYNAENRLAVVTDTVTGQVTRFVYDGDGNRILRIGPEGTTVTIGDYYEQTGGAVRKYYYAGGQRVAMRVGGTLYFLHGDHLGSATLTTDASGNRVGELRYTPYGVTRYEWGNTPTNRRYTGQRWEGVGLYDYRARFYSPSLGRFISADVVVAAPGKPQSLNRYAYVYNSPLCYTDPTGHLPWWAYIAGTAGLYTVARVGYEVGTFIVPGGDQARRDHIGGGLVVELSDVIQRESRARSVDPELVSAVLRHESAAFERRVLTLWPTMRPGFLANAAEFVQSELQGETTSIGPGQMQLRRARELEEMGYVTARRSDFERRLALLGDETSVEYVAGMMQYLTDQLHKSPGFRELSPEDQRRVILIAYNWGWTPQFQEVIATHRIAWLIKSSPYDNETLDEYLRWRAGK